MASASGGRRPCVLWVSWNSRQRILNDPARLRQSTTVTRYIYSVPQSRSNLPLRWSQSCVAPPVHNMRHMPLVFGLQQHLCHPRYLCFLGNYSPIHFPVLCLDQPNYLCYLPSSLSSPAFSALLFSLCLAVPCSAIIKPCALVLCTLQPQGHNGESIFLWQASMTPRLIQNKESKTSKLEISRLGVWLFGRPYGAR